MKTTRKVSRTDGRGIDPEERNLLVKKHLGLVHLIARKLARRLSTRAEYDELVSSGLMGLMKALDAFDPSSGYAFSTFAAQRIRGEILDDLRRSDCVPRSVRHKARAMEEARKALVRETGRFPDEREIAGRLGIAVPTLWRWQTQIGGAEYVSLDEWSSHPDRRRGSLEEVLTDRDAEGVEEDLNREQELAILRASIERLEETERLVVSLNYFEGRKLKEIASVLSLSETRVWQIRAKATAKLRAMMAPLRERAA